MDPAAVNKRPQGPGLGINIQVKLSCKKGPFLA